jgi:hypothetical protein
MVLANMGARGEDSESQNPQHRPPESMSQPTSASDTDPSNATMANQPITPHIKQNQWKKYGQKVLKRNNSGNGKLIRCYFRCNYPGCEAKKQIEKELDADGNVVEVNPNFWGIHCHDEGIFDNQVCYDEDEMNELKSSEKVSPNNK